MAYIPVSRAEPAPLTDVLGIVDDEDGPTVMLVFMRYGRWLVSQCPDDVEVNVIAWAPLLPIPTEYLMEVV